MKQWTLIGVGALVLASIAGCGDPDKAALARQTVQTYWSDINHGKLKNAWDMLTPGQQQANPLSQWGANIFDFLKQSNGIKVKVGTASVTSTSDGTFASVPVHVSFVAAPDPRNDKSGYQHLYWQDGKWLISDESGTLTHRKT